MKDLKTQRHFRGNLKGLSWRANANESRNLHFCPFSKGVPPKGFPLDVPNNFLLKWKEVNPGALPSRCTSFQVRLDPATGVPVSPFPTPESSPLWPFCVPPTAPFTTEWNHKFTFSETSKSHHSETWRRYKFGEDRAHWKIALFISHVWNNEAFLNCSNFLEK